jgi:hypothetical protein
MPISFARFVLAGGPEVALTLGARTSVRPEMGFERERVCSDLL